MFASVVPKFENSSRLAQSDTNTVKNITNTTVAMPTLSFAVYDLL